MFIKPPFSSIFHGVGGGGGGERGGGGGGGGGQEYSFQCVDQHPGIILHVRVSLLLLTHKRSTAFRYQAKNAGSSTLSIEEIISIWGPESNALKKPLQTKFCEDAASFRTSKNKGAASWKNIKEVDRI